MNSINYNYCTPASHLPTLLMTTQKSLIPIQFTKKQQNKTNAQNLWNRLSQMTQNFWSQIHLWPNLVIWLIRRLNHPYKFSFSIESNQQKNFSCDDLEWCRNKGNPWLCESYWHRQMQATIQIYLFLLEEFTRKTRLLLRRCQCCYSAHNEGGDDWVILHVTNK